MEKLIALSLITMTCVVSLGAAEIDDEEQPQTEPEVVTYQSADQIFQRLPRELNPHRDGWTRTEVDDVGEWLTEHVPGSHFTARRVVRGIAIQKNHAGEDEWLVLLTLEHTPMRYKQWEMNERISTIRLTGDDDFVERAEREYREGRRVRISGTILSASWGPRIQPQGERWKPDHLAIVLENVTVR